MRSKALLWLVVAAARAWDFPWSSTEEGWAPAEDAPRPESDPFWVDRAPCEIARVDEETSLLSQSDENPFDPHNGLEITKF